MRSSISSRHTTLQRERNSGYSDTSGRRCTQVDRRGKRELKISQSSACTYRRAFSCTPPSAAACTSPAVRPDAECLHRKHFSDSIGPLELRAETLRFAFESESCQQSPRCCTRGSRRYPASSCSFGTSPSLKLVIAWVREYERRVSDARSPTSAIVGQPFEATICSAPP